MTRTKEQIELCRKLYEALGEKREPKVGEWWYLEGSSPKYIVKIWKELSSTFANGVTDFLTEIYSTFSTERLLHPLYTEGELLEMIRGKGYKISISPSDRVKNIVLVQASKIRPIQIMQKVADSILTALLRLAIEVMKGE